MIFFWIAVIVAFIALEAATVGLVCIWFAIGAAGALIAAALGAGFWLQIVVFIALSGIILALLRPVARRYLAMKKRPTNADRVIGMLCPVTESVDNIAGTGAVQVSGKTWTARSMSGEPIEEGALVRIVSIQGVKLIVEPAVEPARSE